MRLVLRPRVAAVVLGLLALAEAIARLVVGGADAQNALGVCLLALGGTLPLALLPPAGAALAVGAADVLSLIPLHALTVAGAVALLIAAWRLGGRAARPAEQALAVALGLPFVALALAGPRPVATRGCLPGGGAGGADARGGAGRDRPAGPPRGGREPRGPPGHRGDAGRAHGPRRAGPHRPRAARRGRAPHLDDRGAGRDGPADHARAASGRGAAAAGHRGHAPGPR